MLTVTPTHDINLRIHPNNYHRAQGFAPLPHVLLILCTVLQAIVGQTGKRKLPEDHVKKPRSQFSLAREEILITRSSLLTFRRVSYLRVCWGDLEGLHFLVFTILKHERTVSDSIHEPPVWKRTLFFSSKEIQSFPSNETIIDYYNYIQ